MLPFLDSIKYSAKLSNVPEEQNPTITSASYIGQAHSRRRNVRITEIYQCYKLSDTKYALTDATSYTVHVGTSE